MEPLYKSEIALLNDSLFKELPLAVTESVGVDKLYLIDLVFPYSSIIVMHNTAVMSRVASYRGIRLDSIDISYLDYLPRPIIDIYPRDLEKIGLDILRLLENCKSCKNLVELYEKEKKLLIHYLHGLGRARGRVNPRPIALLGGDLIMVLCLRASI
ncbi:MAG: hypothetical protein GXO26_04415, partial [Crenarchaeota archaeon]|nr:hypothetical protein [Thermoproteota archaeon]